MLAPEGFDVDAITFGKDGVAAACTDDYDVIILDLNLPDVDGYNVLRSIRDAGIETPVLVLSGLGEIENKRKCLENGADDYLAKPFERSEFVKRVTALPLRDVGGAPAPFEAGRLTVNLDTNTFLMMYR